MHSMDIKNLLCSTINTADFNYHKMTASTQKFEKRALKYYPTNPSSPCSWSSASSISSSSDSCTIASLSPSLSPAKITKQHQTRTLWTASEDQLLEKGYLQGLSWAMISSKYLPHRSRGCCWGRFKTLQTKSAGKKNWSEYKDRVLVGAIKKRTKLFKQAWKSVALDLNERDWRECELRSVRISSLLLNQQERHALL